MMSLKLYGDSGVLDSTLIGEDKNVQQLTEISLLIPPICRGFITSMQVKEFVVDWL